MSYYNDNDGNAVKGINDYMNSLVCPICNFQFQSTRRTAAQEGVIVRHITECSQRAQTQRNTNTKGSTKKHSTKEDNKKPPTKSTKTNKARKTRRTTSAGRVSLQANLAKSKTNLTKRKKKRAGTEKNDDGDGDDNDRPLDSIVTMTSLLSSSPASWLLSQAPNISHTLICKKVVENVQEEKIPPSTSTSGTKAQRSLEKIKQKIQDQGLAQEDKDSLNSTHSPQEVYDAKTMVSSRPKIIPQQGAADKNTITTIRKQDKNKRRTSIQEIALEVVPDTNEKKDEENTVTSTSHGGECDT
mmetsp:Transcript_24047/g.35789  ORF Transcript_24047/g.35789 Transcript_24047/m.35789 type:complete len:299 (+) Transcript_24047:49-945(+)